VELIVFVMIVVVVAGLGLWLGMLAAPHIGRLAERHDEEPDGVASGRTTGGAGRTRGGERTAR
jgi:hypothetical protein